MIFDIIDNLKTYSAINAHIATVQDFLKNTDLPGIAPGKHQISGEDCFLLVFEYETRAESEPLWEAHRKYLDLHIAFEGGERVSFAAKSNTGVVSTKAYDGEGDFDYELFTSENSDTVTLTGSQFLLFFPQDVHRTGVHTGDTAGKVKKFVFKLKI